MTYEINKVVREIVDKLEKYNENLAWLEADTKKKEEALKPQQKEGSVSANAPETTSPSNASIKELSNGEFAQQRIKYGDKFLTQRLNEIAKLYPEKRLLDIDPQQEKMLELFRQNCSTEFVISQFSE